MGRARGFSGWMAYVHAKRLGPDKPWDYLGRARELMSGARSVVDLGTGGGERFSELCSGYRGRALATEEWHVNAPVAAANLRPQGVDVIRCSSLQLPFSDSTFDLVLDRHEALEPSEVARVLGTGGTVLTQQVWNHWNELRRYFPRKTDFGDHFNSYQQGLRANGLAVIEARTNEVPAAYSGLGDLVYMLCITPWTIPDFDPLGDDLEALLAVERDLTTLDGLVLTDGSYIIEALKP